ncbi:MAG: HNH endonuclease [bacterium]|nr:HNH endonuclease [bacterium]
MPTVVAKQKIIQMREQYHNGKTLTTSEWIEVLLDNEITNDKDISILQVMYSFEDNKAAASQIGMILSGEKGRKASGPINLEIGNWGKRLIKKYPIGLTKREDGSERKWDLFFDGWNDENSNLFIWKMKNELSEALEKARLTGDIQFAEELPNEDLEKMNEGIKKTIQVNVYERNYKARQKCIEFWEPICAVCGFEFEKKYGELGRGFIHVHHLIPISEIGKAYQVDPINDLRPVCPNCHAMLHKTNPPLTIEELKKKIKMPGYNTVQPTILR